MKTREIEMYVGTMDRRWFTTNVLIPADTPADMIEKLAIARAEAELTKLKVEAVFVGVYYIPEVTETD